MAASVRVFAPQAARCVDRHNCYCTGEVGSAQRLAIPDYAVEKRECIVYGNILRRLDLHGESQRADEAVYKQRLPVKEVATPNQ